MLWAPEAWTPPPNGPEPPGRLLVHPCRFFTQHSHRSPRGTNLVHRTRIALRERAPSTPELAAAPIESTSDPRRDRVELGSPGPLRHLAHLASLAHIAHTAHLAKTHLGRPTRVATLASNTQMAISLITMTIIITTTMVSQKSLPAESRTSLANSGGNWHVRR